LVSSPDSSSLEQAQILPQRRLDPSLRINSGPLPFRLGEGVNRERSALPNNGGTLPPSNGEYFVGRESGGTKGEDVSVPGTLSKTDLPRREAKFLACKSKPTTTLFYVDSGALILMCLDQGFLTLMLLRTERPLLAAFWCANRKVWISRCSQSISLQIAMWSQE
jgi:hypothetical protein